VKLLMGAAKILCWHALQAGASLARPSTLVHADACSRHTEAHVDPHVCAVSATVWGSRLEQNLPSADSGCS
jgi:hypothetical protein